jgi:hypothetical protein
MIAWCWWLKVTISFICVGSTLNTFHGRDVVELQGFWLLFHLIANIDNDLGDLGPSNLAKKSHSRVVETLSKYKERWEICFQH